jgi:hypothetical protein
MYFPDIDRNVPLPRPTGPAEKAAPTFRKAINLPSGVAALFVMLALAACAPVAAGLGQAPNASYQQDDPRGAGGMH